MHKGVNLFMGVYILLVCEYTYICMCWNNPYSAGGGDDDLTLQLVAGSSRACSTQ